MPVSFQALRDRHAGVFQLLPDPFDIDLYCRALSAHRERDVIPVPFNPVHTPLSSCSSVTGFWVQVEDPGTPGLLRDVIGYASAPAIPMSLQITFFGHELGHVEHDHLGKPEARLEQLAQVVAPTLMKYGGLDAVKRITGRNAFRNEQEEEAETFAILLRERLMTRHNDETDNRSGMVERMGSPLVDPFRRRRRA